MIEMTPIFALLTYFFCRDRDDDTDVRAFGMTTSATDRSKILYVNFWIIDLACVPQWC